MRFAISGLRTASFVAAMKSEGIVMKGDVLMLNELSVEFGIEMGFYESGILLIIFKVASPRSIPVHCSTH
jgi:hypothetical protein